MFSHFPPCTPADWGVWHTIFSGCEPLTADDIAEIIVFAAGRRQNVVLAETMVYPNHQAGAVAIYKKP
jgi:3-hydroxy acid dehydrogenase/malonic semialdehyde reductase